MVNGNFDPYEMDERVKNYLKTLGVSDRDDPKYLFGKGAIETAGAQGIAGGLAQIGTVHGKTPSVDPFIKSSDKSLQGLQLQAQEPIIDPQVMQYLQTRYKHPGEKAKTSVWKPTGKVTNQGFQIYANEKGEEKIGDTTTRLPPATEKSPSKAQGEAAGQTFSAQTQFGIFKRMTDDFNKATAEGYTGPFKGKYYLAKARLGNTVSPEFDRLNVQLSKDLIDYVKETSGTAASDRERVNIAKTMPQLDMDPEVFQTNMQITKEKLLNVVNSNRVKANLPTITMAEMESGQIPPEKWKPNTKKGNALTPQSVAPLQNNLPPGPALTPEQKKELEIRRAKKQGGQK